jgi:DNA polymerase/3'-5' exonuclease PolX
MNFKNSNIINEFQKLIKQIKFDIDHEKNKKNKIKHSYRLQAIKKVLKILINYPDEIKSSEQLKDIKGIGKGSLERIDEILKFGKLKEILNDSQNQKYLEYIEELDKIYGIGKSKAYELYKKYNIKSIKELQELYNKKKIDLPDNIVKGLKYYGLAKTNIPRSEITKIENYLFKILEKIDIELFGIICGSYRRKQLTSNDIDFLMVHPSIKTKKDTKKIKINYLNKFIQYLKKDNFIVESLTSENVPTKYMGLCKYKNNPIRRIDIRFVPYESYYSAILYFTGPKDFNTKMRRVAINMGYTLNEYGLFNNNKMFKINSEKDIFDLLHMEYLPPEKRN